ncbi:MAG: hypothetical protein K8S62_13445 [Candidatus Sabulitectum sp.]|nr:hypothetical protein [Candidatus Sabulitectum sp.]
MKNQLHTGRGWVKGISMWPNLIPGDILEAEDIRVTELKAGMIAVFSTTDEELLIVHRVLSVRNSNEEVTVESGGDRSGSDESEWHFPPSDSIKKVTGVLRRGNYRRVGSISIPTSLSPSLVVRFYCGIVRRLFW